MSKHTKGPWLMNSGFENYDLLSGGYRAITAGKGFLGSDESPQGFELVGYISEPDALLIAAAPDLLEALEDSLTALNIVYPNGSPVLNAAYAAIAKSRGEA